MLLLCLILCFLAVPGTPELQENPAIALTVDKNAVQAILTWDRPTPNGIIIEYEVLIKYSGQKVELLFLN